MKSKLLGVGMLCLLGIFGSVTFADATTINLDFEDGTPMGVGPAPVHDYNIGGHVIHFSDASYALIAPMLRAAPSERFSSLHTSRQRAAWAGPFRPITVDFDFAATSVSIALRSGVGQY